MDWKTVLSLQPDALNEEQKDELFNTVTWFDFESEEINFEKCKVLLRIGQEVLKYKGEQVETLLHELDELAIKQAEEEAKKLDSDADIRSSKSRKSSSIELENLEQKYIDLKGKYKKVIRINEKNVLEIQKLTAKNNQVERENRQLHKEIDMKQQDGSESDISETVKDQQKELMNTINNKNQQISELLHDIEEVEKDNFILREKITNLKEELSAATNEMNSMTEMSNLKNIMLEEKEENIKTLVGECEKLQEELEDIRNEKQHFETEMENFTKEVNTRIDDWKVIIDKKNAEIQELKSRIPSENLKRESDSTTSSDAGDENIERSHIRALNKTLLEREKQLAEVQSNLSIATKEMNKTTEILQSLKAENSALNNKIQEMTAVIKELKKQLKNVHERCQKLQDEVTHAEKLANINESELKKLIDKIKKDGNIETADMLTEIQNYKTENILKEQKIVNLVKTANKLQETSDLHERENFVLREKLGIPEDEVIIVDSYLKHQKKHTKNIETLKQKITHLNEDKIQLKLEVQKLNKVISSLSNKLLENGGEPLDLKEFSTDFQKMEDKDTENLNEDVKALSEENEALRKGMHQILNSINKRKDSSLNEIKSETLEELLRALDVKHVSGWYHPAMRLQAELHHVEGINKELREQLREARLEIKSNYTTPRETIDIPDSTKTEDKLNSTLNKNEFHSDGTGIASLVEKNHIDIEDLKETLRNTFKHFKTTGENFDEFLEEEIVIIKGKLEKLHENCREEKTNIENELKSCKENIESIEEKYTILEMSFNIVKENNSEQQLKKVEEVVFSNIKNERKVIYLENEVKKLTEILKNTEEKHTKKEIESIEKVGELSKRIKSLQSNINVFENLHQNWVNVEVYSDAKKSLDDITVKYRKLMTDMKDETEKKSLEIAIFDENRKRLEDENSNMASKLREVLCKLHIQKFQNLDENLEKLSQKLAEKEISEISERQRANHTNNLYELVKEQLKKSEEKFRDFTKYNEDILHKNLLLQEQLKEAEDRICNFVDQSLFKEVQEQNIRLLKENESISNSITELKAELDKILKEKDFRKLWDTNKEQELLNLKHQIVDLCAETSEKLLIAQLNSENFNIKKENGQFNIKIKNLEEEIKNCKNEFNSMVIKVQTDRKYFEQREIDMRAKIGLLQYLMTKQKQQYFGCIPLCSEEIYLEKLKTISQEKHEAFLALQKIRVLENESAIVKQQCELELQNIANQKQFLENGDKKDFEKLSKWLQDKKTLQLNELRYRRQCEFKETQILYLTERIKIQDEQIIKLDEQLLLWHRNINVIDNSEEKCNQKVESPKKLPEQTSADTLPRSIGASVKIIRNVSTQTEDNIQDKSADANTSEFVNQISSLKSELINVHSLNSTKEATIDELKRKISEMEMTISMFRKQLGDKQSQITFYEKHILELQSKKQEVFLNNGAGDSISNITSHPTNELANEEVVALKASLKVLQETLSSKEQEIIKYQTLLKEDRDKHSMAAANLQEELQRMQKTLSEEKLRYANLEQSFAKYKPKVTAIEKYVSQVHALEKHSAELHTSIISLEAQLQSSRQEAVRWRSLANDRLEAMDGLRKRLEEQHTNELQIYKIDLEKIRELSNDEMNNLKQLIAKNKMECSGYIDDDIKKLIKEKDEKIYDLSTKLRQVKSDVKKTASDNEKSASFDLTPNTGDSETIKDSLLKENEVLKRRYEHLINKERSLKEENRDLKAQLLKKPNALAKNSKTEKSIKEQLQKKVATLENEIDTLKQKLSQQIAINETHRMNANEDFDKWKKQKFWQQNSEKLKVKLKEQEDELVKCQETCAGYRHLIERLEREKITLENRVKHLKTNNVQITNNKEIEMYRMENMKLEAEVETLTRKLEMQQHHSGALGAAMLQEKLEGQERKMAILELSAKGSNEVRAEIERLQITVSNLQKTNLCLEAENLEMKMDLEKCNKDVPHLQEQIQHLESYIEILKKENAKHELDKPGTDVPSTSNNGETKKVAELERTVYILKRVVEKLQAENKRLVSGKRPLMERSGSAEKLKRDHLRLKEQYTETLQKVNKLESELSAANNKIKYLSIRPGDEKLMTLSDELSKVKEQLEQKSHLLEKVKVLLHRAANKEKQLVREVEELKCRNGNIPSPILEESEQSETISD